MNRRGKSEIVVDSNQPLKEVLKYRQELPATQEILDRQRMVEVLYYSFDNKLHRGQIVVDLELVDDVKGAFRLLKRLKFPVKSVVPYTDRRFMSEDEKASSLNNSSGFNYRRIAKTNILSNHATGRAIDINPALNPYVHGNYNPSVPGTITKDSELVSYFKKRGWIWGGDWVDKKDYMHFEKPL